MGTIKLPKNSIDFFKNNQNQIFESGYLAEGPWNEQLSEKIKSICNVKNAICVNSNGSGLVALLLIYKEYYGRTNVMIQSNTMYGVKTMTKTAGYNLVDIIDCSLETLMPTFEDLKKQCKKYAKKKNIGLKFKQTNIEGEIVSLIQESNKKFDGLIINAAGYTHTSVAIRDALVIFKKPSIELHISNIYKREEFRHKSMISDVVTGIICGLGTNGYILAINAMHGLLKNGNR